MNGIDISNYQAGIDLSRVPCDFVIVLVSEGTRVVNPYWRQQVDQALSLGKLVGVYHYVGGGNATGEADTFVGAVRGYLGRVALLVDWEDGSNSAWNNHGYLDTLVKRVKSQSGLSAIPIYGQYDSYPREVAAANGSPTWVKQYASMSATGYQGTPWNEGAYQADIRQYASSGRLPGWGGNLDLNKYYGDRNQWLAWAGNGEDMTSPAEVWQFADPNMKPYGGNMYNQARGQSEALARIESALSALPGKVWEYAYDPAKPVGGNLYNSVAILHQENTRLQTTLDAQAAAIDTLSKSLGADPESIAKAVHDSVVAKLNSMTIDMKVSE